MRCLARAAFNRGNGIVSSYASLICPLSPLARSLIIAAVVVLALVHMRLMVVLERWLGVAGGAIPRRFVRTLFIGAHIDAALVGGFAVFHYAAESSCPASAPGQTLRLVLPLAAAAGMLLFAWRALWPHLGRRDGGTSPH